VIIFDSVWFLFKKIIKPNLKKKRTETGSNQLVLVWVGSVFLIKTGSNRFGSVLVRFFQFDLVFSRFFGLGSVRFFQFQTYKTETEPVGFFKILIGFFTVGFFRLFFFRFSQFTRFFDFFLTLLMYEHISLPNKRKKNL
jgi:hypothetical protein